MRKLLYTISLMAFLFFFSNLVSAQTINNSADLEKFYTEYFNNKQSRDALSKAIVRIHYIRLGKSQNRMRL